MIKERLTYTSAQALPSQDRTSPLLMPSPYAIDGGELIGADPRTLDPVSMSQDGRPTSPMKAIRAHCLGCSGGDASEARKCTATGCALWPFRMGRNPFYGMKTAQSEGLELDGEDGGTSA
ncbi:hypothetical protein [Inquilinus sp. Marseille-Q2685]|uniref:hypothetical protein n=1 Tax=Inquilinus sp. Marseille-Q2685 TaxID=2866581 RepID=UPI001CE3D0EA|nr:hypothetical protein [Inquilinus sp. Marseille-Q2685]